MRWLPLVVLAACGRPTSAIGWAEVAPGVGEETRAAAFTGPGVLRLLTADDEGRLFLGRMNADRAGRTLAVEGEVWTPELGEVLAGGVPDVSFFDLAKRPGGSELWAYIGGVVGRFGQEGAFQVIDDHRDGAAAVRGALALSDGGDVLHVGVEGRGYFRSDLDQDGFVVATEQPDVTWNTVDGQQTGPMPAPCQLGEADEWLYLRFCDRSVATSPTGVLIDGVVQGADNLGTAGPAVPPDGAVAVADGFSLVSRNGVSCVVPIEAGGGPRLARDDRERPYDLCPSADYVGPWADRATVSTDGSRFAMLYDEGPLILVDRAKPPEADTDLTGLWCRLSGDLDLQGMRLQDDGFVALSLAPIAAGKEATYDAVRWRANAHDLAITFEEDDGDGEAFVHKAHRVGDTLMLRADPELDLGLGWVDPSGLWIRQDGEACSYTHALLPPR
jgi:hypothetical protein